MGATAFSYTRLSTAEQLRGHGLERQDALAREFCAQHDLRLDERSFRDLGVSAFKGRNLETGAALATFIEAVRRKKIPRDAWLLVENLDRLSRLDPLRAMDLFRDILGLGVTIVTLQDGKRWTAESLSGRNFGDLVLSLVTAQRAWEESDVKSRRVSASWVSRRQRATVENAPMTGRCVAWLRLERGKFVLVPDRVRLVRHVFRWACAGAGPLRIARRLNAAGVPCFGRARMWSTPYLRRILYTPSVVGTLRLRDGTEFPGYYPRVVDQESYLRVQARRSHRKPLVGPATYRNLFSRLVECAHCGAPLHFKNGASRRSVNRQVYYLVCAARRLGLKCTMRSWPYADFERALVAGLSSEIDWSRVVPAAQDAAADRAAGAEVSGAEVSAALEDVRGKRDRLVTVVESGAGDVRALTERLRQLQDEEARLADAARRARERADVEKVRERELSRGVQEIRRAITEFHVGDVDAAARERMSAVLHELIERIQVDALTARVTFSADLLGASHLVLDIGRMTDALRAAASRRGWRRRGGPAST